MSHSTWRTAHCRIPPVLQRFQFLGDSEIASAESSRHRLSRYGDRDLNSVLHTVAMIQIRMTGSPGRTYYDKKISEGKAPKEAKRCLKRRLADRCWRTMIRDERQAAPTNTHPPRRCRLTNPEVSRVGGRFFLVEDGRHHAEALSPRGS
ncbi:transposase [Nocardia salmonicida]|uniref:transposase n=1 Tax=Nocardia salmonicida TaxID=53431 RepID=UPI000A014C47|nr:transposase [Nocardia salmonicida]